MHSSPHPLLTHTTAICSHAPYYTLHVIICATLTMNGQQTHHSAPHKYVEKVGTNSDRVLAHAIRQMFGHYSVGFRDFFPPKNCASIQGF